jgi:hypothetical protein
MTRRRVIVDDLLSEKRFAGVGRSANDSGNSENTLLVRWQRCKIRHYVSCWPGNPSCRL